MICISLGIISYLQWWRNRIWILPWDFLIPLRPSLLWTTAEAMDWFPSKCRVKVLLYEGSARKEFSRNISMTEANVAPGQTNRSTVCMSSSLQLLHSTGRAPGEYQVQLSVPGCRVGWQRCLGLSTTDRLATNVLQHSKCVANDWQCKQVTRAWFVLILV